MVRYPYILEYWHEEDAQQMPDGSWSEGDGSWARLGSCNARRNAIASKIQGVDGVAYTYAYEVVMPPRTRPLPIGTKVRIIDRRNGANIFDAMPQSGCQCSPSGSYYTVRGFYRSGQSHQDITLWL